MIIAKTREELNKLRNDPQFQKLSVGFVPTMGALHQGHLSLIHTAKRQCEFVIASIFVNPTQFGPGEDYDKYPRLPEQDAAMLQAAGTNALFMPSLSEMYPQPPRFSITPGESANVLCGKSRPGHFAGVGIVVTKLLNLVRPDFVFLGQKDLQQTVIIRQLTEDLNLPGKVFVCPIIREADGLAMSSRNRYLSPEDRKSALALYHILLEAKKNVQEGMNTAQIIAHLLEFKNQFTSVQWEYIEIVNSQNLDTPDVIQAIHKPAIAVAAKVGNTRLIDNMFLFQD
jgi:pantoate--beta-alanine ligase